MITIRGMLDSKINNKDNKAVKHGIEVLQGETSSK